MLCLEALERYIPLAELAEALIDRMISFASPDQPTSSTLADTSPRPGSHVAGPRPASPRFSLGRVFDEVGDGLARCRA